MSTKTLLIPVEIKSRDLYGRLYLGQKAAQRGYRVLIGSSKTLHKQLPLFPRGVIFEDDITFQCRHFINMATDMGYAVASIDEESIAVTSDERYVTQRVYYPNIEKTLVHFTRGQGDKDAIIKKAEDKGAISPLVPAGNPRLDLLRESAIEQFDNTVPHEWNPDDVILVNSRFSRSNPFSQTREQNRETVRHKFNFTPEQFADFCRYQDHTDALCDAFVPMATKLPEIFPDKIIVFRPHPSENFKLWQDIADKFENAHCLHTGTAVQWAINSSAMVHTGCTTAIESALLGANVLAYCPITSKDYDVSMANLVSDIYSSADDLYAALSKAKAPNYKQKIANSRKAREYLSQHVAGCLEQESCDIILDTLDELNWSAPKPSLKQKIKDAEWQARFIKNKIMRVMNTKKAKRGVSDDYHKQKFPDTTTTEVQAILDNFGANTLKAKPYSNNWWELKA